MITPPAAITILCTTQARCTPVIRRSPPLSQGQVSPREHPRIGDRSDPGEVHRMYEFAPKPQYARSNQR